MFIEPSYFGADGILPIPVGRHDRPANRTKIYQPSTRPQTSKLRHPSLFSEELTEEVEDSPELVINRNYMTGSSGGDITHVSKTLRVFSIQTHHRAIVSDNYTNFCHWALPGREAG